MIEGHFPSAPNIFECVIVLIINNARSPLSVVYYYTITISAGISIMGGDRHQFSCVKRHLILQWKTGVELGGGKASIAIVNRESVVVTLIRAV